MTEGITAHASAILPVLNMEELYAAFPEIGPGDAEYLRPGDRVVIW